MKAGKTVIPLLLLWMLAAAPALPPAAARSSGAGSDFAAVDAYLQDQMNAWNIPGAALVIVQGDQVVHLQSFGQAGTAGAVTPQTPFEIGSCTKSFTAMAVMQLVEQGKVNLDAPVQDYLPWFRVADTSARITIRHLLNQTSGLPTRDANRKTMVNPDSRTLEDQVRLLRAQPLTAPPGTLYQYSNLNYMTLALVIETLSGQSYGDYIQSNVFTPLGMQDSFSNPAAARPHGLSDGHTWWFGLPVKSLESPRPDMLGAGYLLVSPEDMSHWLIAQLNGGVYEGSRILSAQGIETMHTPASPLVGEPYYGMGWVRVEQNGQTIINHDGQSASFTCSMILLPEEKIGIAVLANVSSLLGPHAASSLAFHVKDVLLTGQPVQVDPAFSRFYLPWDLGFLLATGFLLWSVLVDLPGWRRKIGAANTTRRILLPFVGDGLLMLAAFLGLPLAVGFEVWRGMFVWQPDAAYWCLAAGTILLVKLILRVVFLVRRNRQIRP